MPRSAAAAALPFLFPLLVALWPPGGAAGSPEPAPPAPLVASETVRQVLVQLRGTAEAGDRQAALSPSQAARWSAAAGVELRANRRVSGGGLVLLLPRDVPLDEATALCWRLEQEQEIAHAEPDRMLRPALTPTDPQYPSQWEYFEAGGGIGLPAAWDVTTGAAGVVTAVVDSGVLRDHPDLLGRTLAGYDFITFLSRSNDGDGRDPDSSDPGDWTTAGECAPGSAATSSTWHGTHLAGTIGGSANNGAGGSGINWVSPILPVRVMGRCGAFTSDLVDGMRWAAGIAVPGAPANNTPARVLNLSMAAPGACSSFIQTAVNDVTAQGALVVVSAGNGNVDVATYSPANCVGVTPVGATTRTGSKASYSNFGAGVFISAPGDSILSTGNAGTTSPGAHTYITKSGTSMAAAHVSGVASLMLSANPGLTRAQMLAKLQSSARAFPDATCTTATCGAGIVDAAAAVRAVSTPPTVSAGPNQTVASGSAVSLSGSATDDGATLAYAWTQLSGTPVMLVGADTPFPSFTAPAGPEALTFQLAVTDDVGLTSSALVGVSVGGDAAVTIAIPLLAGWNQVSWPLATCSFVGAAAPAVPLPTGTSCSPVAAIADVFASIAGQYDLVRSFDATGAHDFDPALPAPLNDLTYVAGGYGYWIRMKVPGTLSLTGPRLPPGAALALGAGWNLAGYWGTDVRYVGAVPTVAFPPGLAYSPVNSILEVFTSLGASLTALRSHDGNGDHVHPGALPPDTPVEYVGPGYGYWIKVIAAGSLRY